MRRRGRARTRYAHRGGGISIIGVAAWRRPLSKRRITKKQRIGACGKAQRQPRSGSESGNWRRRSAAAASRRASHPAKHQQSCCHAALRPCGANGITRISKLFSAINGAKLKSGSAPPQSRHKRESGVARCGMALGAAGVGGVSG